MSDTDLEDPNKILKILIAFLLVLLICVLGIGGIIYYTQLQDKEAFDEPAKKVQSKSTSSVKKKQPDYQNFSFSEVLISNIRTERKYAFVQMKLNFILIGADAMQRMQMHSVELKSGALRLMSSRSYEELSNLAGKDVLAQDIKTMANAIVGEDLVFDVVYTFFLLERSSFGESRGYGKITSFFVYFVQICYTQEKLTFFIW